MFLLDIMELDMGDGGGCLLLSRKPPPSPRLAILKFVIEKNFFI